MKTPRRPGKPPIDPSNDRGGWRPAHGYLVIAFALTVVGLFFLLKPSDGENAGTSSATSSSQRDTFLTWNPPPLPGANATSEVFTVMKEHDTEASSEGSQDPTRDLSFYVARGEKPTIPEVIARLHQAGVHSGLGAFSPPGTRPPLVGLAVPEDFVLPPGYVRHHQATDDGQRIEAILMYSPDHQFVDAANQPIAVPKDRVVPPEHAPPGLPIRRIAIPAPLQQQ
jgi:hypothetical protein